MPLGSSAALILRISVELHRALVRDKLSPLHLADAVLGRDRAAELSDRSCTAPTCRPSAPGTRPSHADRLGDVVVHVAVAEMTERQGARARADSSTAAPARAMNSGMRATGTDTSCLMLPPSGFCASDTSRASARVFGLGERAGEAGIGDEALLDPASRSASAAAPRRRPVSSRKSPSARTRDGAWRRDRACRGTCRSTIRDGARQELERGQARGPLLRDAEQPMARQSRAARRRPSPSRAGLGTASARRR